MSYGLYNFERWEMSKIMNGLVVFENSDFGSIRIITMDNEPWFVVGDVCKALGLSNPTVAVQRLEDDERAKFNLGVYDSSGSNCVNEYGLYNLILASRKKEAKEFKRWITHEVIPSIRKNGGYIVGQENLSEDELLERAVLVAQRKIAERDKIIDHHRKKIEQDRPKVIFADAVSASKTSILIGDLAKLICQNGVQIGQKRLFDWLRKNDYLIKSGSSRNMPQQRYVEQGLFGIKESTYIDGNGCNITTKTPVVTGKGQIYFVNKFLSTGRCISKKGEV